MTTPMRCGMRLQTRPAKYQSKSCQAEAAVWSRPGSCSFSFTGDFPGMADDQPVEATSSRRRNYTAQSRNTGTYRAVRRDETRRMPAVNRHGVQLVPAIGMFLVLLLVLGGFAGAQLIENNAAESAINQKRDRIFALNNDCAQIRSAIAIQSNDMNIRQEAVRMGLISSKGVAVEYLEGPQDAVITLKDQSVVQSLASIWGQ